MGPLIKLLVGVVLLVVPLALYAYDFMTPGAVLSVTLVGKTIRLKMLESLSIVLQGTIPLFVALVGLFIIWLELDEWKIEKELKTEEEKSKKKPGRKKKE